MPSPSHFHLRAVTRGFDPLTMVVWHPAPLLAAAPDALAAGYLPFGEVEVAERKGLHFTGCTLALGGRTTLPSGELEAALARSVTAQTAPFRKPSSAGLCPWCFASFSALHARTVDPASAWVLLSSLVYVALDRMGDVDLALRAVHTAWFRDDDRLVASLAPRLAAWANAHPRQLARSLPAALGHPARSRRRMRRLDRTEWLVILPRHDHDARFAWVFEDFGTPLTAAFAAPAWFASRLRGLCVPRSLAPDPHALAALVEEGIALDDAVLIAAT